MGGCNSSIPHYSAEAQDHSKKVQFDAKSPTSAAPKRRGRKATGVVTKDQLLSALTSEADWGDEASSDGSDEDDHDDDSEVDGEGRARVRAPKERGRSASKRRGGRGAGGVTKQQLADVLQKEVDGRSDDSDEGACRVKFVVTDGSDVLGDSPRARCSERKGTGFAMEQDLEPLERMVRIATPDASASADLESRRRCSERKGTGHVTKQDLDLLKQKVTVLAPEDDGEAAGAATRGRCSTRRGTGFATKEDVRSLQPRVTILEPDASHGASRELALAKRRGRKPTGALTKEQLLSALRQEDDDDEDSDANDARDGQAISSRSTSPPRVRFAASDGASELPSILAAPPRCRTRRGTGPATKEQLMQAFVDDCRGKSVSFSTASHEVMEAEQEPTDVPWRRCAGRKGTAPVCTTALEEHANAETPLSAWMCGGFNSK